MEKDKIPNARVFASGEAEAKRMIEFAKLHVKAALEAAVKQADISYGGEHLENSIINSYPESNIK